MTYTATVETGSHSIMPDATGKIRWETYATCGHRHRSYEAAERCGERRRNYDPKTQTCSALWYNYRIHDNHGHRVEWNDDTSAD